MVGVLPEANAQHDNPMLLSRDFVDHPIPSPLKPRSVHVLIALKYCIRKFDRAFLQLQKERGGFTCRRLVR